MSEEAEEYEEQLVYLDFRQFLPFDELIDPDTQIKIIGLDTEHPIAQVNGRFYEGKFEFATGTKLFFTESTKTDEKLESHWASDTDEKIVPFECVYQTNKVLQMNRVFITSKSEDESRVKKEPEPENSSKYDVTTTYSEVLSRFLPPGMEPPRIIPDEDNGIDLMNRERMDEDFESGSDTNDIEQVQK